MQRRCWLLALLILVLGSTTQAQSYQPKLLRFDEDYSRLTDSIKRSNHWLRLKQHRLSNQITLSVGLDYREMYELVKGYDSLGTTDGYWLTRLMVHSDWQVGKHWRFFVQLGRAVVAERKLPARPVDADALFLLNAFAEYRFGKLKQQYIRVGQQELFLGMGRLVSPREGPNVRSTYDAARLHFVKNNGSLDAFMAYLVNNQPGVLDNKILDNNQRLWGLYSTWKKQKYTVDLYYLGFYNPSALYSKQAARAKETRHSIGIRWYGKSNTSIGYDAEATVQLGKFGNDLITAWMLDAKIYQDILVKKTLLKPSFKIGFYSGNQSLTNNRLNTFNPLFPNLLYYQTAVGVFPSNLINPQLNVAWIRNKLTLNGGMDGYWRASKNDGLYAPFGVLQFRNGNGRYLGYQLYSKTDYSFNPNLMATLLISRYVKSDFVQLNPDRRGIDLLVNILLNYKL